MEVEFAVFQLAGLGQPLTQRIEAIGLRLQLAEAGGKGVDLLLRLAPDLFQLPLLRGQTRVRMLRAGDPDRDACARAQQDTGGKHGRKCQGPAGARTTPGGVRRIRWRGWHAGFLR